MQIDVRFINQKEGCFARLNYVCEHLAPNLKAKACPENLPRNPLFWAEHMKSRLSVRRLSSWRFDIHSWPSSLKRCPKIIELFREVIPNISKISCAAIIEQR